MPRPQVTHPRGILNLKAGARKFRLTRYLPAPDVHFFVERYWIAEWDLQDEEPYDQENIPFPCINLVFEAGESRVYGIETGKSVRRLEGTGRVVGVKFKPGGFYPFIRYPISQLTGMNRRLEAVFAVDSRALEARILEAADHESMIDRAEHFIRERLPEPDGNVALINQIINSVIADRTITKVDDVVKRMDTSKRTLQRLFSQYVGVSPKWVIQRYRLHEAAEQVAGGVVDWPRLALELGYFDQAHFIKDFKAMIGRSPAEYARQLNG